MKKTFTSATLAIGMIMLIMAFLVTLQIKSVIYNYKKDPASSMRPNELMGEIEILRKTQEDMLQINNAVVEMKNVFDSFNNSGKVIVCQL